MKTGERYIWQENITGTIVEIIDGKSKLGKCLIPNKIWWEVNQRLCFSGFESYLKFLKNQNKPEEIK